MTKSAVMQNKQR